MRRMEQKVKVASMMHDAGRRPRFVRFLLFLPVVCRGLWLIVVRSRGGPLEFSHRAGGSDATVS